MKKLVLHLGLQKTGSTSIQETFFYNPEPLARASYVYANINWPNKELNSNHSLPMIVSFSDGWHSNEEIIRRGWAPEGLKQHFRGEVLNALETDRNLILSGEDITDIPEDGLRAFSALAAEKGFDVRPVMFVRPPLEFVTSMSQSRIRHGLGYHVFADGKSEKIVTSLKVWSNLQTFAFRDAVEHPFGPLGILTDAVGLPSPEQFNIIPSNESMSDYATRIIGHVNTKIPLFLPEGVNPLRTYLDTEPLAAIRGPKFSLTRTEFSGIRNFIQRENAAVKALLGSNYCDATFAFQAGPQPWTDEALAELAAAMKSLSATLQECILSYFQSAPEISAADRAAALEVIDEPSRRRRPQRRPKTDQA